MVRDLEKYKGRTVEIIYIDRNCNITQRKVELRFVQGNTVGVFCLYKRAPRTLKTDNILAASIVVRKRSG